MQEIGASNVCDLEVTLHNSGESIYATLLPWILPRLLNFGDNLGGDARRENFYRKIIELRIAGWMDVGAIKQKEATVDEG